MRFRHRRAGVLLGVGLPLVALVFGATAVGRGWSRTEAGAPALQGGDERQEAIEDVELLEAYVKAKEAQLRQAEQRAKLVRGYRDDAKAKQAKGLLFASAVTEREMQLLEAETDQAFRAAELKDFQVRLARARRRLARLPAAE